MDGLSPFSVCLVIYSWCSLRIISLALWCTAAVRSSHQSCGCLRTYWWKCCSGRTTNPASKTTRSLWRRCSWRRPVAVAWTCWTASTVPLGRASKLRRSWVEARWPARSLAASRDASRRWWWWHELDHCSARKEREKNVSILCRWTS